MTKYVTITCDGDPLGTKVRTEDGSEIHGISSIHIDIDIESPKATAKICLFTVSQEVRAQPEFFVAHPLNGNLIAIKAYVSAAGEIIPIMPEAQP